MKVENLCFPPKDPDVDDLPKQIKDPNKRYTPTRTDVFGSNSFKHPLEEAARVIAVEQNKQGLKRQNRSEVWDYANVPDNMRPMRQRKDVYNFKRTR
jgi:hypothetical protein